MGKTFDATLNAMIDETLGDWADFLADRAGVPRGPAVALDTDLSTTLQADRLFRVAGDPPTLLHLEMESARLIIAPSPGQFLAPTIAIYAHTRCCSVLQLAQSEKLVTITADWQLSTADLSCLENPSTAELRSIFDCPAQQRLIHALMAVLDGIYSDNLRFVSPQLPSGIVRPDPIAQIRSPNWTKLTLDLAQSWLEFYRDCRIFGDVQRQNPRLAIARCGLTAISRRYLQVLLENYLGLN